MLIDDSSRPKHRSFYTPDTLVADIYIASGNFFTTLATPSDSWKVINLTSDSHITDHTIIRKKIDHNMEKIGYWYRYHDIIRCQK